MTRTESNRSLAYQYKKQMNDIVFYAYKGHPKLKEMQSFRIDCYAKELKSRLGDCEIQRDGSSLIRIFYTESMNWENALITVIHEVSHHVDYVLRGTTGHDKPFYDVHTKLLITALDMGIMSYEGIQSFWNSKARNAKKLAGLMQGYTPHPIPYKTDISLAYVYNSYAAKEVLKERGYRWNSTDQSWYREVERELLEDEHAFLISSGVNEKDIEITDFKGVINRRKTEVQLYNVEYVHKDKVKALGYKWDSTKRIWHKKIDSDDISKEERLKLQSIGGVKIIVVK